jgi:hypothetical protein
VQRRRLAGVVPQHAQHPSPPAAGAGDRRADIERVERAQLVEVLLDQVGDAQQQRLPLKGFCQPAWTVEGSPSRGHRAIDILGIALGHVCQQRARGRIAALEGLTRGGIHPPSIDQHLLAPIVQERRRRVRPVQDRRHVSTSYEATAPHYSRMRVVQPNPPVQANVVRSSLRADACAAVSEPAGCPGIAQA